MARLGCFTGVLLMLVAFAILMVVVVLPVLPFGEGNPTLMNILAQVTCQPGETFEQDFSTYSIRPGEVTRGGQVYCVDAEGQQRNVTGDLMVRAMAGFIVPFVLGLFLTIGAAGAMARNKVSGLISSGGARGTALRMGGATLNLNELIEQARAQGGQATWTTAGMGGAQGDAAERLREAQRLFDEGLINRDEYERLRQRILDENV